MTRTTIPLVLLLAACAGGGDAASSEDLFVLGHSPGNGDQLDPEDSLDGVQALNSPALVNPGAVTVVFTTSLDPASVLGPGDPQGTRNVRLTYFDTRQGPFDPQRPEEPGVNPPGAHVLVPGTATLATTHLPDDTLVLRPSAVLAKGQYSVRVGPGVRTPEGDGIRGPEYFFFFRVGEDLLGPVVVKSSPAPGARDVDPTAEVRITMSETILASTVNDTALRVSFQPAGAAAPTPIPGRWFADGGNGPGNNFPLVQLDHQGLPGRSGTSSRNGVDLVFRVDLEAFPANVAVEDPFDPFCTVVAEPPRKGNRGFPRGQAITVEIVTQGAGLTDTVGNPVPDGSPQTTFTFEIARAPPPVFAPNANAALFYGDTFGVGVIDIDPSRTPYLVGPNPPRAPHSVVTAAGSVVRVPVPDLVDLVVDARAYTAFHSLTCPDPDPAVPPLSPSWFQPLVYASSRGGGGEVVVVDPSRMAVFGRFRTPSPGGLTLAALGATGYLAVTNFSANTATFYDIGRVAWYDPSKAFLQTQAALASTTLILDEEDFARAFPHQRADPTSPPGPPIFGTLLTGVGPTACDLTELPGAWGPAPFTEPLLFCVVTTEGRADFVELPRLTTNHAVPPDQSQELGSAGTDVEWAPILFSGNPTDGGRYLAFLSAIGGSVSFFVSGGGNKFPPSVRPEATGSAQNRKENTITFVVTGFDSPTRLLYITEGAGWASRSPGGYGPAVLVTETGANRVREVAMTNPVGGWKVQVIGEYAAGLGPVDLTGDPFDAHLSPFLPRFTIYYTANAGEGRIRSASYQGGVIGASIPTPGVFLVATWWNR